MSTIQPKYRYASSGDAVAKIQVSFTVDRDALVSITALYLYLDDIVDDAGVTRSMIERWTRQAFFNDGAGAVMGAHDSVQGDDRADEFVDRAESIVRIAFPDFS